MTKNYRGLTTLHYTTLHYTTPLPHWLDAKSCVHAALTTLVWDSKAGKWLC